MFQTIIVLKFSKPPKQAKTCFILVTLCVRNSTYLWFCGFCFVPRSLLPLHMYYTVLQIQSQCTQGKVGMGLLIIFQSYTQAQPVGALI